MATCPVRTGAIHNLHTFKLTSRAARVDQWCAVTEPDSVGVCVPSDSAAGRVTAALNGERELALANPERGRGQI